MSEQNKMSGYDSEPVVYCAKCYSLRIKHEDSIDADCCMDCGCSDIKESSIETWEKMYEMRYGKKFTRKSNDVKNHPVFKMSLRELRHRLCKLPVWKLFVNKLYPEFPRGLNKTDSALLLFDKLLKDCRVDEFRMLLIKYYRKEIWQHTDVPQ